MTPVCPTPGLDYVECGETTPIKNVPIDIQGMS